MGVDKRETGRNGMHFEAECRRQNLNRGRIYRQIESNGRKSQGIDGIEDKSEMSKQPFQELTN